MRARYEELMAHPEEIERILQAVLPGPRARCALPRQIMHAVGCAFADRRPGDRSGRRPPRSPSSSSTAKDGCCISSSRARHPRTLPLEGASIPVGTRAWVGRGEGGPFSGRRAGRALDGVTADEVNAAPLPSFED